MAYRKWLSELGLFYSAAVWGSTFFVVKDTLENINPIILVGYRFILAAILLAGFCLITNKPLFKNVKHGFLLGFFLWFLYISQTVGLGITTASNSGFITGLFVVFVPVFSLVVFKRMPSITGFIATVISLSGLWVLTGGLRDINNGDLLTLIAAMTYAIHILFADKYIKDGDDACMLSFLQFTFVGAASLITGAIFDLPFSVFEINTIWVIVFLAIIPTLSAFVIQVVAQKFIEPLRVSLILAFEPVFAALFAWTLGSEQFIFHRAIGGFFIFLGMIISGIPTARARERMPCPCEDFVEDYGEALKKRLD